MPVFSYLAYPVSGSKEQLLDDLTALDFCEVTSAENEDVLILVTDTPDEDSEKKLQEDHKITGVPWDDLWPDRPIKGASKWTLPEEISSNPQRCRAPSLLLRSCFRESVSAPGKPWGRGQLNGKRRPAGFAVPGAAFWSVSPETAPWLSRETPTVRSTRGCAV